jgi:hypothetical protein
MQPVSASLPPPPAPQYLVMCLLTRSVLCSESASLLFYHRLLQTLVNLGMQPVSASLPPPPAPQYLMVTIDGKLVGYVASSRAPELVNRWV